MTSGSQLSGSLESAGRFERVRGLGAGAFGQVHLVRDTEWAGVAGQEFLAEKVIPVGSLDADGRATALAEVDVLMRLDHPGVVKVCCSQMLVRNGRSTRGYKAFL